MRHLTGAQQDSLNALTLNAANLGIDFTVWWEKDESMLYFTLMSSGRRLGVREDGSVVLIRYDVIIDRKA